MLISVSMGGRRYGGYPCGDARVEVRYLGRQDVQGEPVIDFEAHPEYLERLTAILLGQVSPCDITSIFDETIVYAGETIARLHVAKIAEDWAGVFWEETPWAEDLARMQRDYARANFVPVVVTSDIVVDIAFADPSIQQGGTLALSPSAAAWVGGQLLSFAEGLTRGHTASLEVRSDLAT